MWVPELTGVIDRRLLVNYRVDPDVLARVLPAPFRPQLVGGVGVAGICLIRLTEMRPRGLPGWLGLSSENAAHRIAVEWDTADGPRTGVYIPRRDSSSLVNVAVGGRAYPGTHHRADFDVAETDDRLQVGFAARDGSARAAADVRVCAELPPSELFADIAAASAFFQSGCDGWSCTASPDRYDGLRLLTAAWRVEPGAVEQVSSSFFDDRSRFPEGSAVCDDVLVMRRVPVSWAALPDMRVPATA